MDSSRLVVCSGLAPWREGSWARCSFSTWIYDGLVSADLFPFLCSIDSEGSGLLWGWWLWHTAISKSTIFSAKVDISLLKQKVYSPTLWAVKTKSPWRSFVPSRTILPPGAVTV